MVSNHFSGNIDLRRLPLILIQSHIKSDHYVSARLHDVQLITVQMNDPLLCKWDEGKDVRRSLRHFHTFSIFWLILRGCITSNEIWLFLVPGPAGAL